MGNFFGRGDLKKVRKNNSEEREFNDLYWQAIHISNLNLQSEAFPPALLLKTENFHLPSSKW